MFRSTRFSSVLFLIFALLMSAVWVGTVAAQEEDPLIVTVAPADVTVVPSGTESEAPVVPPIIVQPAPVVSDQGALYLAFGAVMLGILAVFTLVARPLILQLGSSAPAFLVQAGLSTTDSLIDSAEDYASTTPVQYDDAIVSEVRTQYEQLAEEIRRLRGDLPIAGG